MLWSNGTRSDWLLHMAEKEWCDLDDFIAAFRVAITVHKSKLGKIDVAASIAEAKRLKRQCQPLSTSDLVFEYDREFCPPRVPN